MMRQAMLDRIGLFDETFFLYFEETDLFLRAARAGWPADYVRESRVVHIGSVSTGLANINESVAQSSRVSEEIADDISKVSSAAGEITGSSNQMREQALQLQTLAGELNAIVSRFRT